MQIKALDSLLATKYILSDLDKADILLVANGFKPSALVDISYSPSARFSKTQFKREVGELEKILKALGLKYKLRVNYPKNKTAITRYSFVARDLRTLHNIIRASKKKHIYKRRMEVGILLEYPASAVKAFAEGRSFPIEKLPERVRRRAVMKFLNFRLSEDWKKELLFLERKAGMLKSIAPDLYKEITKNRPV
jgi:hypothetical protein